MNDVLLQPFLENETHVAAYETLKEALESGGNYFYGNYFLGVKDGGPGDPDITWTGLADVPEILTGERAVDAEILAIANEYESLFDLCPYDNWGFFEEDKWSFSVKIGIKKKHLQIGDFEQIVVGY